MIVARIVAVIAVMLIAALVGAWMFSGERRYLGYARQVAKFSVLIVVAFLALMMVERLWLLV